MSRKPSIPTDMGGKQHKDASVQNLGYKSPCHSFRRYVDKYDHVDHWIRD